MSPIFAVIWGNIALWGVLSFWTSLEVIGSFVSCASFLEHTFGSFSSTASVLFDDTNWEAGVLLFSLDGAQDMRTRAIWGFSVASVRDTFLSLEASVLSLNWMVLNA